MSMSVLIHTCCRPPLLARRCRCCHRRCGLQAPAAQAPAAQAPAAAAAPVVPAETPEQLLKRVDTQANAFKDATFRFKLRILDPGGVRESEFTTQQKGAKRIVRFLSPANVKGMGVLVENADTMYVLLPEFNNRVRRVGTHQAGQSFMGSDVSNEDMSLTEFLPTYEPSAAGTEGGLVVLLLKVRGNKPVEFPQLKLWIEPKDALITKLEYMDGKGNKLRTQERLEYTKDGPRISRRARWSSPIIARVIRPSWSWSQARWIRAYPTTTSRSGR